MSIDQKQITRNKYKTMKTETRMISPKMAEHYLRYNTNNRSIRAHNVNSFVKMILQGEFALTHQGLAFEGDSINPKWLMDGQHRLMAIIKTDTPQKMQVSWNCDPEMFHNIDSGAVRSFKDLHGYQSKVSSLCKLLLYIAYPQSRDARMTITDAEMIMSVFGSEINDLLDYAGSCKKGVSSASTRAAAVILMQQYPSQASEILEVYKNLTNLRFDLIPPIVQRLYTRLIVLEGGSKSVVIERFLLSYKAMNPKNWDTPRLMLYHSPSAKMQEIGRNLRGELGH